MKKKILVIEAFEVILGDLRTYLSAAFPDIPIVYMTKELFEGDVEGFLKREDPAVIILARGLGQWKHPSYKSSGLLVLPWIKKELPQSMVIFTANSPQQLEDAIQIGVHIACEKGDILKHFNDIRMHFDLTF